MAIIQTMEVAFDDIKHIIIDILLVECHCVLFYIWVSECPKYDFAFDGIQKNFVAANTAAINLPRCVCSDPLTPGDFAFGVHAKEFCRCEYRGDYSAAFCVYGSLGSIQTGRANVKTTASLLYKNVDATRPA